MSRIMVTGANGYIGYPLVYELTEQTDHTIIGVDNNSREKWVRNIAGNKANADFQASIDKFDNFIDIVGDLSDRNFVNELLAVHTPDVIIHLASQPSMPYSHINGERALYTQINNTAMWVNLIWGLSEYGLRPKIILTTTTGIPGQSYKKIPEAPVLNMAGSFYHVSRGFDSANAGLAAKMFGFNILELRTAIVYGLKTDNMRSYCRARFDTDYYFGTALNRFVDQAVKGKPITIYGKGNQTKPFISLNDTVQSLVNAIKFKFKGHTILNQTTETISINKLAGMIEAYTKCKVSHIPNPRKENESHRMVFENKGFLKLLKKTPDKMKDVLKEMVDVLTIDDENKTMETIKVDCNIDSYIRPNPEDFG